MSKMFLWRTCIMDLSDRGSTATGGVYRILYQERREGEDGTSLGHWFFFSFLLFFPYNVLLSVRTDFIIIMYIYK